MPVVVWQDNGSQVETRTEENEQNLVSQKVFLFEPIQVSEHIAKTIEEVRSHFLLHHSQNSHLYDDCDVEKIRLLDWSVKRFVLANDGDLKSAIDNLCQTLQWRKEFGVNQRSDQFFPDDFFKLGAIFLYDRDKNGRLIIYFRICLHYKVKELVQLVRQFFVHQINKIDELAQENQWILVFDCSDSGLSNVDMELSRFMVQVLTNHFPLGYKNVIIHNLPLVLLAFWSITKNWLPYQVQDIIQLTRGEQIFALIDPENVPAFIDGGRCTRSVNAVPVGVEPAEKLAHLGFSRQQINYFRSVFKLPSSKINGNNQSTDSSLDNEEDGCKNNL